MADNNQQLIKLFWGMVYLFESFPMYNLGVRVGREFLPTMRFIPVSLLLTVGFCVLSLKHSARPLMSPETPDYLHQLAKMFTTAVTFFMTGMICYSFDSLGRLRSADQQEDNDEQLENGNVIRPKV